MTEAQIQKSIVDYCEMAGHHVYRMNAGRGRHNQHLAPSGTPDLLIHTRYGDYVWLEVKKQGGKLSEAQTERHKAMRLRGAKVYSVWSLEEAKAVVDG